MTSKKVLVIGSGGREHALIWKLAQSPHVGKIYAAPGNGGISKIAEVVPVGCTDTEALLRFARSNKIDLTVIGQEAASDAGVVDAFKDAGLTIFGPTKAATKIESSKAFSKDLMAKQNIPTANYKKFESAKQALTYLATQKFPLVIKASGLAEGKGAVVCENMAQAQQTVDDMMIKKVFKDAGTTVVIEDFLSGQEVSIHALCDGKNAVLFPASQDHKQAFDGDTGPNTGGMGVIAPVTWVNDEHMSLIESSIVKPALEGLDQDKASFTGCLYPGLMIDKDIVNVIEFNARFGDPEAEVYMRLLDSDLFEILDACANSSLNPAKVSWKSGFAISVALCSGGYPGKYEKGLAISGIEEAEKLDDIAIFHAGTTKDESGYKTAGGRVLHVTATGTSIDDARSKAYSAIKLIDFEGMIYRTDIGLRQN